MPCHVMASRAMPGHILACHAIFLRVMPCHDHSMSCRVKIFLLIFGFSNFQISEWWPTKWIFLDSQVPRFLQGELKAFFLDKTALGISGSSRLPGVFKASFFWKNERWHLLAK